MHVGSQTNDASTKRDERVESISTGHIVETKSTPVATLVVDETRRAVLERKAKADPVVQKVTEMFRANVKEVRPK
jgi:hypothetical protein